MPAGDGLLPHLHEELGFAIALPVGWGVAERMEGIALAVIEPTAGVSYRPNVFVTVEPLEPVVTAGQWAASMLEHHRQALAVTRLEAPEEVNLDGRQAWRLLVEHEQGEARVVLEQWLLVERELGFALWASAAVEERPRLAKVFAAIAAGFDPSPAGPDAPIDQATGPPAPSED